MKQTHEITAHPTLNDAFVWTERIRFSTSCAKLFKQRLSLKLAKQRKHLWSLALVTLISGLFLTGSYLFLIQLARYGW